MRHHRHFLGLAVAASAVALASCGPEAGHEEGCTHLEGFQEEVVTVRQGMTLDQVSGCSLAVVRGLDTQIIDEMNCLVEDALVNFEDLNIALAGTSPWPLLQPPAKQALARAIASRGITFRVNSIYRTIAQQYLLYQWSQRGQCGISIAATPGRSNHQSGLAVDISDYQGWRSHLEAQGWDWYGSNDVVHFDYEGSGARDIRGTAIMAFQRLWNRNHPNDTIAEDGLYGPQTEAKLRAAPLDGFTQGAVCDPGPDPDPDPDPDPMPEDAEVSVSLGITTIEGQDRDLIPTGSSEAIFDVLEGQRAELTFTLRNGQGRAATDDVLVGYQVEQPWLALRGYTIESDFPARDGRTWQPSDANGHPDNPAGAALGQQGFLHLYPLGAGESKRVRLTFEGASYDPDGGKPFLRLWVKHIGGYYGEGDSWDDSVEVNMAPELLRRQAVLDVLSRDYWEWNGGDERDLEGWSSCGDAGLRVQGGALLLEGGADSCLESPPWTQVDADSYKALAVRLRHSKAGARSRVIWRCPDTGEFDAAACSAWFDGSGDGQWEDAVVDLKQHPQWRGAIKGLRVLPIAEPANLDGVALDSLTPLPEAPDGGANNGDVNNGGNNGDVNNGGVNNGGNNGDPANNDQNNGVNNGGVNNGGVNNGGVNNGGFNNEDDDPGVKLGADPVATGSGGCSTAPGSPAGGAGALLLLLGWLGWRRRGVAADHHPGGHHQHHP